MPEVSPGIFSAFCGDCKTPLFTSRTEQLSISFFHFPFSISVGVFVWIQPVIPCGYPTIISPGEVRDVLDIAQSNFQLLHTGRPWSWSPGSTDMNVSPPMPRTTFFASISINIDLDNAEGVTTTLTLDLSSSFSRTTLNASL